MKILIVDDSNDDRRMLRYVLQAHEHDVMEAGNGLEGLQTASTNKLDLIISDVLMPVMDGFQFLRNLRVSSSVPFIFYSAVYDSSNDMQLATSLGANGYIIKPKDPLELMEEIGRIMDEGPKEGSGDIETDAEYQKRYSQVVVSKLEDKVRELEEALAERKKMELRLQQAHEFTEQIINSIPDPIFVKDRQHRFFLINNEFCSFTGHTREELIGKSDYDFFPKEEADEYSSKDELVFNSDGTNLNEETLTDATGSRHFIQTRKASFVAADGKEYLIGVIRNITERKLAEEALAAREQAFRTLAENSPDVIVRYDRECRRIYVNPAFERINRLSSEEVLGKSPVELSTELALMAVTFTQRLKEVMETGMATQIDLNWSNYGVDKCWFVRAIPEFDANGKVVSALTIWLDITERKRAEEALAAREQEFRSLAENLPDNIVRYDREGRTLYINPSLEKTLGMQAESIIGKSPMERGGFSEYIVTLKNVIATEVEAELEMLIPDGTGDFLYHQVKFVPERDNEGIVTSILAIGHDNTEQKRAELALKSSEERYRFLFENSPISIWEEDFSAVKCLFDDLKEQGVVDFENHLISNSSVLQQCAELVKVTDINQAALRLHNATSKDELLAGLPKTFTSDSFEAFRKEMISLWNGSTEMVNDATVQTLDGEKRFVIIHVLICQGYESSLAKVLVSLIDITKRKIAEEALIDKKQRLSDMTLELTMAEERERRRIATNLHDTIGQDLALTRINLGVLAKASLAAKESKILDNTQNIINDAIKKVRHLTNLISPPILESAGLETALKWLGIQMEADYGLQVLFKDDLSEKTISKAIQTELYFAARELLINVAKHAKTGTARISVCRESDSIVIRIEDDGIGFSRDFIDANHAREGGFGLFNIRRRITYLGGTFEVESTPATGTRVTIGMPLEKLNYEG